MKNAAVFLMCPTAPDPISISELSRLFARVWETFRIHLNSSDWTQLPSVKSISEEKCTRMEIICSMRQCSMSAFTDRLRRALGPPPANTHPPPTPQANASLTCKFNLIPMHSG